MKADRTDFDKTLRRHMSLFGAPSANQLDASRARIRERLRDGDEPAVPVMIDAPRRRHTWRTGLLLATAAAAVVIVIAPWPRAYALKSTPVLRILAAFTKGMIDTSAPVQPVDVPAAAPSPVAGQAVTGETPSPAPATAAAGPDFEEASIKPCDPDNLPPQPEGARGGGPNSFQLTPGRLRALCMTVATLIRTAYGFGPIDLEFLNAGSRGRAMNFSSVYGLGVEDGRRVRGGPDWVRSERYTIEAVTSAGQTPSAETLRGAMLQRLLERHLQLKAHIDVEQIPAFALTAAKGGPKIKPATADACERLPPPSLVNGQPGILARPRSAADVRRGEKPSCALWAERNGPNMAIVGGAATFDGLARLLAGNLGGVRVLDRTGVTDKFNFVLEFAIDENAPGFPGRDLSAPAEAPDVPPAATIFTALEEQLGLKLERAQAAREFIVIDRIERPMPN